MLETLDYTIRIGSTPTFLYFNLYLYSAYAAHYVYYIGFKLVTQFHIFDISYRFVYINLTPGVIASGFDAGKC